MAAGSFNLTGTDPASQAFGNFNSPGSFQVWLVAQDSQDPPLRQGVPTGVGFAVPDLTPPALEASLVPDSVEAYACAPASLCSWLSLHGPSCSALSRPSVADKYGRVTA